MIRKLLKYDFRSLRRFAVPLLIALGAIILLGACNEFLAVLISKQMYATEPPAIFVLLNVLSMLFSLLIFFLLSGVATAVLILVLVDFYQSLVTDQAYLTFTLPVRVRDILLSKLISGGTWILAVLATLFAGLFLIPLGGTLGAHIFQSTPMSIATVFSEVFSLLGEELLLMAKPLDLVILVGLVVLLIPVTLLASLLLYEMAIFFASVVSNKNKLVIAIVCIFGLNMAYSFISGITFSVIAFILEAIGAFAKSPILMFEVLLSITLILMAATGLICYFLTKHMMEKKLNLP